MKAKNRSENFFLLFLLIVGVTLLYGNTGVREAMSEPLTPGEYGRGVTMLLIILVILRFAWINLVQPLMNRKAGTENDEESRKIVIRERKLVLIEMALLVLYAYGMTKVGYFTSTYLFSLISLILLTDNRSWKRIAIYAAALLVFCYLLYLGYGVFHVMMPNSPFI